MRKHMLDTMPSVAYDEARKAKFHSQGAALLRRLAKELGLGKEDREIRHSKAGIAVSGEIILHSDTLYVQISQSCLPGLPVVMWRICKGRRDATGGQNNFCSATELLRPETLARIRKAAGLGDPTASQRVAAA